MGRRRTALSESGWDCFKPVHPQQGSLQHLPLPFLPLPPSSFRHINVGSDFQAELPELQSRAPSEDEEPATLVWKPWAEDDSDMEKPDRGSFSSSFSSTPDILGSFKVSFCIERQLFAGSASLPVSPIFPSTRLRGKENALLVQQSRKKSKHLALQIGQAHLPLQERRLACTSSYRSCSEGRASTAGALASAGPVFALLFMLSKLLPLAPGLSFRLAWQPLLLLASRLTLAAFLLCLQ